MRVKSRLVYELLKREYYFSFFQQKKSKWYKLNTVFLYNLYKCKLNVLYLPVIFIFVREMILSVIVTLEEFPLIWLSGKIY